MPNRPHPVRLASPASRPWSTHNPLNPQHDLPEFTAWQAHVDAGRIGNRLPTPPHVAAIRDANDALFRSFRGARVIR